MAIKKYTQETAFASDLGIPVSGPLPVVRFDKTNFFFVKSESDLDGDVKCFLYRNESAEKELVVFND